MWTTFTPKVCLHVNKLAKFGVPADQLDELIEASNKLPNLQLLEGTINNQKRQKMPHEWYVQQWPDVNARQAHLQSQAITSLPEQLNQFMDFIASVRKHCLPALEPHYNPQTA